jgi:Sec-independent protein translocase protein TatA
MKLLILGLLAVVLLGAGRRREWLSDPGCSWWQWRDEARERAFEARQEARERAREFREERREEVRAWRDAARERRDRIREEIRNWRYTY